MKLAILRSEVEMLLESISMKSLVSKREIERATLFQEFSFAISAYKIEVKSNS